MTQSRRDAALYLKVDPTTNASLWLDKYYDEGAGNQVTDKKPKQKLVDEITNKIQVSELYSSYFHQWRDSLEQYGAVCREAQVEGRLAINLGAEAVLETSIALHHTYGVSFIPGSALKGLVAHYAKKHLEYADWGKASPAYHVVFGNTETAGYITFFDALYIPRSGYKGKALWPDIITVHHPDYYQSGDKPPADWDDPTPIPFLSATGRYLVALAGPAEKPEWVEKTFEILAYALEDEGIGAKTNSGYGRMRFVSAMSPGEIAPESMEIQEPYELKKQRLLHETPPVSKFRGTITKVHSTGRYGKINPAMGGAPIFVHISQLKGENQNLEIGQVVEYQIGQHQGRAQAQNVTILLSPKR
jgi:CRISPR-associated protein Cmr6